MMRRAVRCRVTGRWCGASEITSFALLSFASKYSSSCFVSNRLLFLLSFPQFSLVLIQFRLGSLSFGSLLFFGWVYCGCSLFLFFFVGHNKTWPKNYGNYAAKDDNDCVMMILHNDVEPGYMRFCRYSAFRLESARRVVYQHWMLLVCLFVPVSRPIMYSAYV